MSGCDLRGGQPVRGALRLHGVGCRPAGFTQGCRPAHGLS